MFCSALQQNHCLKSKAYKENYATTNVELRSNKRCVQKEFMKLFNKKDIIGM